MGSDISNAFSRTDRISQIYELILAGEFGKYLSYSYNTYTGTITLIKGENEFTDLIIEWIGARQGALKSAPDFKLYNIPLHTHTDIHTYIQTHTNKHIHKYTKHA